MDFLDPKKRKAHRRKLFIGYALMAIALLFGSIIFMYQAYGYDIDPRTGQIVQNGFIFVSAHPDGANVYLNRESKGRTDLRLDVRAGDYTLELQNDGYRSWKRVFTLEGGRTERFVYPFLFPTDLKTSDAQTYASAPGMITQTPDRKTVVVEQPGSIQNFDLLDVTGKTTAVKTITLPATVLETKGAAHALSVVEWSTDNKHVILKHVFEGGQEFILMDISSPGDSVNLSRVFSTTAFTTVAFKDKKYNQYYLLDEATKALMTANLSPAGVAAYQDNVLAFHAYGDQEVLFITDTGASAPGKVAVKVREGNDSYKLREIAAGSKYLLDLTRFNDSWYVAAGTADDDRVYIFKNPVAAIKSKTDRLPQPLGVLRTPEDADFVSFSANARFIASQSGDNFAVYDAENARQYRYTTGQNIPAGQQATWMDGHRLTSVVGGKTVVFDYDGTNLQTLNGAYNGSTPLFDPAYEAMFTFSPSVKDSTKPSIVRTELKAIK